MGVLRAFLIALGLIYLALRADAAGENGWGRFYQPSTTKAPAAAAARPTGASEICLRQIRAAQETHGIPDNLLLAIGIQEAGRRVAGQLTVWPWTANAQGKGLFFDSKAALEDWVQQTQARGIRSVDVGCMQINQRWHAHHFASLAEATDPAANVDYAARFLRRLFAETQDWREAAGRYHSSTPAYKEIYLQKLTKNLAIAQSFETPAAPASPAKVARASTPGLNWTSDMTSSGRDHQGAVHSIYSNAPLRPILPAYAEAR